MYFVQYLHEVVGDYSVNEDLGTIILRDINGDMDGIIEEISNTTKHSVLSIKDFVPLKK